MLYFGRRGLQLWPGNRELIALAAAGLRSPRTMHGASRLSGAASSEDRHIALSNFTDLYISSLVPPRIVTTYIGAEPASLLGGAALRFACLILLEGVCRSAGASTS